MTKLRDYIETPEQEITLERLEGDGLILDIGGGGEGLVSRIGGERVCAIDIRMSEIREAQIHGHQSNWFVADGRTLCFREEVFDIVTLWFSLAYMSDWNTKRTVLEEAHRVLRKNGRLSILASHIPEASNSLVFWGKFILPDGTVSKTGYGVRGGQNQTLQRILNLVSNVGFSQLLVQDNAQWFKVESQKS
ncbi:MAG: class I SAM-dependent methyltransferase [Candidatus Thorarchaeota archaeon]